MPHGDNLGSLKSLVPVFVSYALKFYVCGDLFWCRHTVVNTGQVLVTTGLSLDLADRFMANFPY